MNFQIEYSNRGIEGKVYINYLFWELLFFISSTYTKIYVKAGGNIKKLEFAIKYALKQKKITQKEYAESIHLAESTFSNYVKGTREMNYQMLSKIADDLALDLNAIFKTKIIDKKSNMISEAEANIINAFRQIPREQQSEIATSIISLLRLSRKLDK